MKILKINIIGLFLGVSLFSYGQQQKYFSNYHYYNLYAVNAASSVLFKSPEIFLGSSVTNINMEGRPSTVFVSGVLPFKEQNFALGVSFLNDQVGVFSDNSLKLSYAYRIQLRDARSNEEGKLYEHSLSLGIDAGIRFLQDDLLSLDMSEDPTLARNYSKTTPIFGASAMYNHLDFFVGLSVDNLVRTKKSSDVERVNMEQERPFYLYGGYRFWTSNRKLLLMPNILVRHNFETPTIVNYNLRLDYNDTLEAGIGYIDSGAVNFSFGVKLWKKNLHLIYNANLYTTSNFYGSLHGIMLKYCFKRE